MYFHKRIVLFIFLIWAHFGFAQTSCLLPDIDHLPPQMIDDNSSKQNTNQFSNSAKELFEQSQVLSIVPKLLDMAQIKEFVPVINEIEVKKDKDVADYLMLNEIYAKLGEPEKQIKTLEAARAAIPNDPRPLILLALKKIESGDHQGAKELFFQVLKLVEPSQLYLVVYAFTMAEPGLSLSVLVLLIWILAYALKEISRRKSRDVIDAKEINLVLPTFIFITPIILAVRFYQTGKALLLALLVLIILVEIFILIKPILNFIFGIPLKYFFKAVYFIFNGTILAKKMQSLSGGTRILIAMLSLFVGGAVIPTIKIPELKIFLSIMATLMFYSTIGSLLNSFFYSRKSLSVSLRWVAIAATFPFLISYVVSHWNELGQPFIYAQLPTKASIDQFVNYLLYWVVSLGLALHLGKIMAQALIDPIHEIVSKVKLIELGDFTAKVKVISKDEIGALASAVNHMGEGLAKREKLEKTFSQYVDKKIATRIMDGLDTEARIKGEQMDAVILFADIRGFTNLSEKSSPQEIVSMLNQYLERMVKVVKQNDGVIDKFIGDNVMAVWGVPNSVDKPIHKAVQAGIEMLNEIKEWNEELIKNGHKPVGIGIGINSGPVVAGSLGSSEKMEYTVIGDTVNTAKRIEAATLANQLLVSESCYEVIKNDFKCSELPAFYVKGKDQALNCYQVN